MTKKLFFDTDCLSSFLWVEREDIILLNYSGRIVIPQFVYEEFCRPGVQHLLMTLDNLIRTKTVIKMDIPYGSSDADLFRQLTKKPVSGMQTIGKGEASALVLAKSHDGIVASNNLRDVKRYADEFNLQIMTTAEILVEAYGVLYISLPEADKIWKDMLLKKRKLPTASFSEYLKNYDRFKVSES